jgi:hypothetical protein
MKITKSFLRHIIKEELENVLEDEKARRPMYDPQQAPEVYQLHWEEAVREIIDPTHDEEYDDYDPESKDPEAKSNVGFALSHLQLLLRKNSSPSTQEIIEAIDQGWEESSYEFQYQQEREYEDEDY